MGRGAFPVAGPVACGGQWVMTAIQFKLAPAAVQPFTSLVYLG